MASVDGLQTVRVEKWKAGGKVKKSGCSVWHGWAAVGPTDSPDALVFTYNLKQQLGRGLEIR